MSGLNHELRKIPPVTRFLCISSLVLTVAIACEIVPYRVAYWDWTLAIKQFQIWRYYTSFFLDRMDIWYLWDLAMLYLNSSELESSNFATRSPDYAWGLLVSTVAITILNHPLRAFQMFTPLLLCITYLRCQLAAPGHQTSLYGLITLPTVYYPFFLLLVELFTRGKQGLLHAITGVIVGHVWYWGVFDSRALWQASKAPEWVKRFVAKGPLPSFGPNSGVHVFEPKARPKRSQGATPGYKWGSGGSKLGSG